MRPLQFVPFAFTFIACTTEHDHAQHDGCDDETHDAAEYKSVSQAVTTPDTFTFVTLDIGQGDSAVVIAPGGCAALLDGGPTGAGTTIKTNLRSLGITRLDFAVVSHYHADHMGGMDEVEQGTDGIPITKVYDRGGSYSSVAYDQYAAQYAGRRQTATRGMTFALCDQVVFEVVAVNGNGITTSDENAKSLVVKLSYRDLDALVGGDVTGTPNIEQTLLADVGSVELYKVHHHGSAYSTTQALVDALQPTVALISVGWNNTYGHPTQGTLDRLTGVGSQIWQTEDPATSTKRGHITIQYGVGSSYTVAQGANSATHATKASPDTTAPTVPANLAAVAASATQVDLSWSASTDEVGVVGYRVLRAAAGEQAMTQVADTSSTSWSDATVAPGTTYSYAVSAYDAAANASSNSASISVQTAPLPDTIAPAAPSNLSAQVFASRIDLAWTASTDNVGVTGYRVLRAAAGEQAMTQVADTGSTSWSDTTVVPGTTYSYAVSAYDAAGNASSNSASISVQAAPPPDTIAPTAPSNLSAQVFTSRIDLGWTASTDNVGVVGYRVFRNGVEIAQTTQTSWSDTGLAAGTNYSYAVDAIDAAGNVSASATVSARTNSAACTATITQLDWSGSKRQLTVGGQVSQAPATVTLSAGASTLATATTTNGSYLFKLRLSSKPACVTVSTSCGGTATRCF